MEYDAIARLGMNEAWFEFLRDYFESEAFTTSYEMWTALRGKEGAGNVYPAEEQLFHAFSYFDPMDTRVVIIGDKPQNGPYSNGIAYDSDDRLNLDCDIFRSYKRDRLKLTDWWEQKYGKLFALKRNVTECQRILDDHEGQLSYEEEHAYNMELGMSQVHADEEAERTGYNRYPKPWNFFQEKWVMQGVLMFDINISCDQHGNGHYGIWREFVKKVVAMLIQHRKNIVWMCSEYKWHSTIRRMMGMGDNNWIGNHLTQYYHSYEGNFDRANKYLKSTRGEDYTIDWIVKGKQNKVEYAS